MSIRTETLATDHGPNQKKTKRALQRRAPRRAFPKTRLRPGFPLAGPVKSMNVPFDHDPIVSAVLKGRPVVFDNKLMIAQPPKKGSTLAKAGVVLFSHIETINNRLETKLKWMTISALALAIELGRAHLAEDDLSSGDVA